MGKTGEMQSLGTDVDVAVPYTSFIEPARMPGVDQGLACVAVDCGNPACDTGCHNVAMLIVSGSIVASYRYEPATIRLLAAKMLAACDEQEAKSAKRAGKLN